MSNRDGQPALPPTRVDIPPGIRLYLMSLLNQALACTVDLRSQVKQVSWNVKGKEGAQLQALFESIATELDSYANLLADRLVGLGRLALGTARTTARQSTPPEYPGHLAQVTCTPWRRPSASHTTPPPRATPLRTRRMSTTRHDDKALFVMRHEEGWMERANACAVLVVRRWRALPLEHKLYWLLRFGVIGCFIGHGAYGLLTKEVWVPYFGVVGIDWAWAYRLMPWIGVMDIGLGLTMAVVPLRVVLLHLTVWGLWTAALRPLSGDVVWEFFERAGNYGVPLAFLVLAGVPCSLRGWFAPVWPSDLSRLTVDRAQAIHGILRVTTFLLLLGHGALGAFNSKPALTAHYASIGLQNVAVGGLTLTQAVGGLEIALAVAVLVAPFPSLLIGICLWKMGTETLFMTSGSLPFEWIERAGSYIAPLALYYLIVTKGREVDHVQTAVALHETRCDDAGTPRRRGTTGQRRGRQRWAESGAVEDLGARLQHRHPGANPAG